MHLYKKRKSVAACITVLIFFLTTHYLPQSICLTNEHFLCRMPRQKCIFQNDVIFIEFFILDFLYCIIPYRTGSDIQVYRIVSPLDEIVQYRYRYCGLPVYRSTPRRIKSHRILLRRSSTNSLH